MARQLRPLDPQSSAAALFGAELRALRQRHGLSLAGLGELVHVSGDLLGKVEKAQRRPQPDLITRLDDVLAANGLLIRRGAELRDDLSPAPDATGVVLTPLTAASTMSALLRDTRAGDHAMRPAADIGMLVEHARAAGRVAGQLGCPARGALESLIGEAYQLAGWMAFDAGHPAQAERLLVEARTWAERARDAALAAYVLGPNLSFIATYGGQPELGVERAYGALGWARRSGNHRLVAFAMAIGARAHARLGETALCLGLLDAAHDELGRHPGGTDREWLSVFDEAALDGHRGSCLLDLGHPDRALDPLAQQSGTAPPLFVRNRIIWQLDQVDALLRLGDHRTACTALVSAAALPIDGAVSARVRRRFRAVGLTLDALPDRPVLAEAREACREFTAASA